MADGKLPTIAELLSEIRDDLDEPLDTATNFWDDAYLLGRLNRGFRQVWQQARETKENQFVRTLTSTDDRLQIYGRDYDPAQLQITAGAEALVLPPDFAEALTFDALLGEDDSTTSMLFEWVGVTSETFRAGRRVSANGTTSVYAIDVQFGDGGPRLLLSPAVGADATSADTTLTYVYQPKEYASTDTLENSGFTRVMCDAAVAYAVLEARRKEGVATNIALAQGAYAEKIGLVTRSSGPRQSQAPEVVEGVDDAEWWN